MAGWSPQKPLGPFEGMFVAAMNSTPVFAKRRAAAEMRVQSTVLFIKRGEPSFVYAKYFSFLRITYETQFGNK
jgi:hypothetical protein